MRADIIYIEDLTHAKSVYMYDDGSIIVREYSLLLKKETNVTLVRQGLSDRYKNWILDQKLEDYPEQ